MEKLFRKNPYKEIDNLKKTFEFLKKNSKDNYLLITDYQFLNVKLGKKNIKQINKWYHPGVSYPLKSSKYHGYYLKFFKRQN